MASFASSIYRKLNDFERKFANDPDQFILLRHLTFLFAIRYDSPSGVLRRAVWYGYRSVLMCVFGSYCYKAYWHMTHSAYSFPMFNILGTLWIFAGALVRVIVFNRSVLVRLERFLNDRSFCDVVQEYRTARNGVQRQNNRYLLAIPLILLLETFIFLGSNLIVQPEFMLVYSGHVVGGLIVQLLYGCTTCYWGSLYVIVFSFIYVMLNAFRGEMLIVVQSFNNINQLLDQHRPLPDASDASIAQERKFWYELRNLLKQNIQRHVELLENLEAFRKILAPFSFIQYYGSFVLIAYYCFIITYKGLTSLTVVYIGFIMFLVVESYLFCRIISTINDLVSF
uniref:Gustatory receptor n=1 Tax=Anopheles culicifacies TaxID=139723 RepID=A0A182LU66_9DIPT